MSELTAPQHAALRSARPSAILADTPMREVTGHARTLSSLAAMGLTVARTVLSDGRTRTVHTLTAAGEEVAAVLAADASRVVARELVDAVVVRHAQQREEGGAPVGVPVSREVGVGAVCAAVAPVGEGEGPRFAPVPCGARWGVRDGVRGRLVLAGADRRGAVRSARALNRRYAA